MIQPAGVHGSNERVLADAESTDIQDVEAVHVFFNINGIDHFLVIEVIRQAAIAPECRVRFRSLFNLNRSAPTGLLREVFASSRCSIERIPANFLGLPGLVTHVNLAGGVFPDKHHSESRV